MLTREQAHQLLLWAHEQNPGPWLGHSQTAAHAAETLSKACGLDAEKAYIMGLLHDIGRYEGVRGMHHVIAGYELMLQKNQPELARICLTHSFPLPELDAEHKQMMAEAEAAEREMLASEGHIMTEEAKVVAKAFYGIRLFVEKYGYTQADLETYARCMFNRADATGQSLEAVVSKKDQFLGYSENNQLVKEYYDFAIRFVNDWHKEEVKPCDISYQFAELEDDGIWLVKTFNADGKERRWKA